MRLIAADAHGLTRAGIQRALESESNLKVVAQTDNGAHLLALIERLEVDLVLLDAKLPGIRGELAIHDITARHPNVMVIALAFASTPFETERLCAAGASGMIMKTIEPSDLAAAIRHIVNGTVFAALGSPDHGTDPGAVAGLTRREQEILAAIAEGHSNKVTARQLSVTEQTIKFHLTNIYRKLGITNRTAAARWAYQHGLTHREKAVQA